MATENIQILISVLDILRCHKYNINLFIFQGSIQILSGGNMIICLRCKLLTSAELDRSNLQPSEDHCIYCEFACTNNDTLP